MHVRTVLELVRAPNDFIRLMRIHVRNNADFALFMRAFGDAETGFASIRRDSGLPYVTHVIAVTGILALYQGVHDIDMIVSALLHDHLEDLAYDEEGNEVWTYERICREYGSRVGDYVKWLTHVPCPRLSREECLKVRWARIAQAPREVVEIKSCDVLHNLRDVWSFSESRALRKAREASEYLLPLASRHHVLVKELREAIQHVERSYT